MEMKVMKKNLFLVFVLLMVGCASTAQQESFGEYVDNSVITSKVKSKILDNPTTKFLDISVKTFKGIVQLSGFVSSAKERATAGKLAASVKGVRSVKNNLLIRGR